MLTERPRFADPFRPIGSPVVGYRRSGGDASTGGTSECVEVSHPLILEVIPMISRAYRATRVNDVDWDRLARGNEGVNLTLGIDVDVGKHDLCHAGDRGESHPGWGFHRRRAGELGRSLPPPAPPASLSLSRDNESRGRLTTRSATRVRPFGSRAPATAAAVRCDPSSDRERRLKNQRASILYNPKLLEGIPRRGRGYLRPPICPATFSNPPSRP